MNEPLYDISLIFITIIAYGFFSMLVNVLATLFTPYKLLVNTGYSMCPLKDPLLEYLPITDKKCSWTPFNVLVINTMIDKTKLNVGDNVCYFRNFYGKEVLICHRIFNKTYKSGKIYYFIKGLGPNTLQDYVPYDKIFGKVVDKIPRGAGASTFIVANINPELLKEFVYINKGGYLYTII